VESPQGAGQGRHGDLFVQRGLDQLIVARLLEIPNVRVEILTRHPDWIQFRKEISALPRGAYSPLSHPDLQWVPSRRVSHDRWDIIRRELIAHEGSVLDIGCDWGYFCERFESLGFRCTGVEVSPKRFYFLEKLRRANNYQFDAFNMSIFDFIGYTCREFDVVLALAVFHWFLKDKRTCTKLEHMLGNLRTRELFFMPHIPSEATMQDAYWNPSEDKFADFVMESAGLGSKRLLGYVPHGRGRRSLYQLTP
jgi:SAM-dependent methyltransferase